MRRPRFRSIGAAQSGATAVEFALVVVPMLLVLLGVTEFGRFFWTGQVLQRTAIRAARCMGILQSDCAAANAYSAPATASYVQAQSLVYGVPLLPTMISLSTPAVCGGVPSLAGFSAVQITYTFTTLVPTLIPALANGVPLTVKACFPNQA